MINLGAADHFRKPRGWHNSCSTRQGSGTPPHSNLQAWDLGTRSCRSLNGACSAWLPFGCNRAPSNGGSTQNADEAIAGLEGLITARTKAIVPAHYADVGCEMNTILEIASRHGIAVVEDNAHGLLGRYRDKNLGTFGQLATLSFHETKNISCGDGGALLINDLKYCETKRS